jgi:AcrR family transcriptional regulator
MPRRIHQSRGGDSGDIFVGRWRVAAIAENPGKDAEVHGRANRRQVVVGEEARVDDGNRGKADLRGVGSVGNPRKLTKMVVLYGTSVVKESVMAMASTSKRRQEGGDETAVRERILDAAFAAFMKSGYAAASMLEIATRARVSKRELYALVGNKQEMLIACISERAKRLDVPADLPLLRDRETLARVLASFGTKLVREISDPTVIAVFRLAISEVVQAPEVARALNSIGRGTSRAALRRIMAQAQASGLLTGRPVELAEQFAGLLWRDLMVSLLLGVVERPTSREIAVRARDAAAAFLQLYPLPKKLAPE